MTSPIALVGVSIPRSGHHHLASMLQASLGDDLSYCEFYSDAECCRSVPCTRGGAARVRYQKGHDLDLALPVDLPGVRYLVQYRDPVAEAVSDRELFLSATGFTTPPTSDQYTHWLAGKVRYFAGFAGKWLRRPLPEVLVIDYDRLVADPVSVLDEVCRHIGISRSREAIEQVSSREAGIVRRPPIALAGGPPIEFSPRRIEESPCFRPDLLAEYESAVLERVPELESKRRLPRVDRPQTALSALVESAELAATGDHAGAGRRLTDALVPWPEHAYLHLAAGRLAVETGDVSTARAAIERAAELAPSDPEILFLLADVYRGDATRELAVDVGRRVVDELPASAGHRLFYAVLLDEAGRHDDAVREALHAQQLGIIDPHHHALFRQVTGQAV